MVHKTVGIYISNIKEATKKEFLLLQILVPLKSVIYDLKKGLTVKINGELEDPNKLKKRQIVTHFTIIM